ncbi:Hypothetical protein SRAE_0000004200 [Strongyloides ratti]|uniref:Uncharacterized protein n=1 Tax=Strongyloides ratti TaxID=34506 RepID=A0A090KTR1_STRRB|nr:Hypothetical protein SRAE_0000004200 [Strongyloides ratti]CEF60910.1 Hypothetical protein SRAE_0000004200 [Strongyloides ratti]
MDIISSTSQPSISAPVNQQQLQSPSSNLPISTSLGTHSTVNNIIDSLPSANSLDLTALFGDVSKTVSGLTDILGATAKNLASDSKIINNNFTTTSDSNSLPTGKDIFGKVASQQSTFGNFADKILDIAMPHASSSNPLSGIFGGANTCFKTCGMEDIQYASIKAAETMVTLKYCLIFMTIVTIFCMLALTGSILYFCFYKNRNLFNSTHPSGGFQILNYSNKDRFTTLQSSTEKRNITGDNPSINSDINIKI